MTVVRDGTWNISCQVPVIQIPWRNRYVIITEVYLVPPGCFASATCLGPSRLRELPEYVALEHRNNVVGWFTTFACYPVLDTGCPTLRGSPIRLEMRHINIRVRTRYRSTVPLIRLSTFCSDASYCGWYSVSPLVLG